MADTVINRHCYGGTGFHKRLAAKGRIDYREGYLRRMLCPDIVRGKGKVLVAGCGPDMVPLQLADIGFDVTAFDSSEGLVAEAERNALEAGISLSFVCGDAERLPFGDGSFDIVVSDRMLGIALHPERVIEEWNRVLRDGGRLVYTGGGYRGPADLSCDNVYSDPENVGRLWSCRAWDSGNCAGLLADSGFRGITVGRGGQKKIFHMFRRRAQGQVSDRFVVSAYRSEANF